MRTLRIPTIAGVSLHATTWEAAVLAAVRKTPPLLFSLPAGAWCDRVRTRPLMVTTSWVCAAAMMSTPLAASPRRGPRVPASRPLPHTQLTGTPPPARRRGDAVEDRAGVRPPCRRPRVAPITVQDCGEELIATRASGLFLVDGRKQGAMATTRIGRRRSVAAMLHGAP
ncbi:hypothetical protein RB196_21120 [Streptomyces sp. PmtA]|uniref:hypothetical protein n=1 Tax=Streptomyces sp. PmtA TaxID=3074275 RepID=UPI0030154D91